MKTKVPTVSIITATYNSAEYVSDCIQSAVNQTYDDFELIITDDCSTDKTFNILNNWASLDKRIKVFRLEENQGAGVARNNSISNAHGRYIAFLDSDDKWHPNKLEKHLDFIGKKNALLSFTSYNTYNEEGNLLKRIASKEVVQMKDMLKSNYIGCSTAIYDQSVLGKIYMPKIRARQDYGLWITILKESKVAYGLNEPLTDYLVRQNSVSRNKLKILKYQWKFYRDVIGLSVLGSIRSTLYWFFYSLFGIKNRGK